MWITFFQKNFFQKVADYPLFVDWGCGLPTSCWCHISRCLYSCLHPWKKSLMSLRILNKKIKHFVILLLICKPIKFWPFWDVFQEHIPNQRSHGSANGTRSKFRGIINQMCLVIQLHLHWYPTNPAQVGLISTLLSSTTLVWFPPLLEHQSPSFNDFETFFEEFYATFGDSDKKCTLNIKI